MDILLETLRRLKPQLAEKYAVSSIGLFGSVVRYDFTPDSTDVDMIVDFSKTIGIDFVDLADEIESRIKRKVDLVSRQGIKPKYFKAIEQEIIYV